MAVEDKQGISRLEQVVEEISEAERAKELKKEHKRMKKKKRKENKCKFASEMAEKKESVANGHVVNSQKNDNVCENGKSKETCKLESDIAFKEERPECNNIESKVNPFHLCKESSDQKTNFVESKINGSNSTEGKTFVEVVEDNENSVTDLSVNDSCYCGDDTQGKPLRRNGFFNTSEEKPSTSCQKEAKGLSTNGFVTPPGCRSCGQPLSPRNKFDRDWSSDRDKGATVYSEMCAKCAAMNLEGGNRRSRKRGSKPKEVSKTDTLFGRNGYLLKTS